jgi:hypothetical protein
LSRVAEKVPGWVESLLIPTLESKVRSIVREEVGHLEKVIDARFEAVNSKMDGRFEAVNTKIDSLEKRFPSVQELAEIRARLKEIEKASR